MSRKIRRLRTLALAAAAAFGALAASGPSWALSVFACEPEYAALSSEIGGSSVTTFTATTALQDPHQIQARPSLIAKARAADITVCAGSELEIGWLPQIIAQSANRKIAPGSPGSFEAARYVTLLDRPARVDRSMGDIHPGGNPHLQTDPRNMLPIARALAARFAQIDPANAAKYNANYAAFSTKWKAALARWAQRAAPLRGQPIVVQHQNWVYLESWLGMKRVTALEPKPGVPPSAGYLANVLATLKRTPARMVIRSAYEDPRASTFIAQRAGIPAVVLPYTIGGTPGAKDLYSLYDDTITRLLAGLK
ncbi:MAG: zinc ABC transporter substrate-binding protein [Caulobacteraceae bacterium]|nr:zinc ABC transporter substrate-binding protein [Caulobacteraceae bacterium]